MSSARNGLVFLKQMVKFRTEATKSFENVLQGVSRHLCTPRFLSFVLYRPFELSPILSVIRHWCNIEFYCVPQQCQITFDMVNIAIHSINLSSAPVRYNSQFFWSMSIMTLTLY